MNLQMKIKIVLFLFILTSLTCNKSPKNYYNYETLLAIEKAAQNNAVYFEFGWRTRDSLQIYSQCWQPEEKPRAVLCLVHGHGEHSGRYTYMAKFLTDSGFALAAFDLRGHGRSQGQRGFFPKYNILLEDITLFLKEIKKLYNKTPLFLYGQSLGGNLVINYTLKYEPRLTGVIVAAPLLRTTFKPPAWKIFLGKIMYTVWPTLSLSSGVDLYGLSRDTNVVRSRLNDTLYHNRVTPRFLDVFKAGEWVIYNTERLDIPLLLMHGNADKITSVDASREFASSAGASCELKIWEGYYHAFHEEVDREVVFEYLLEWMKERMN